MASSETTKALMTTVTYPPFAARTRTRILSHLYPLADRPRREYDECSHIHDGRNIDRADFYAPAIPLLHTDLIVHIRHLESMRRRNRLYNYMH